MNCRECEPLLVEVARDPDTSGRRGDDHRQGEPRWDVTAALQHAATCPACADRLAEERSLQSELRSLAMHESVREPSAGCEATLMAAFRTERGREVHTRRWMFAVSGAMAASLVVLLGAALILSSESTMLVESMSSEVGSPAARNRAQSAQTPSIVPGEPSDESPDEQDEEVTDFVAFYPGADVGSLDSGALVRVRMPSSALAAFSLPVAQNGDDPWVSADLLVGEDGSPQAIRFVRPVPQASRN